MIFFLFGKMYIYSFDRALSTVKNCADRLFKYFEILLQGAAEIPKQILIHEILFQIYNFF